MDYIDNLRINNSSYPVGLIFFDEGRFIATDISGDELPSSAVKDIHSDVSDSQYNIKKHSQYLEHVNGAYSRSATPKSSRPIDGGYIYAIIAGHTIKIGRTKSPKTRLRTYSKAFENYRLLGMYYTEDYIREERVVLSHFGGKQTDNEWIGHSPRLEADIVEYFAIREVSGTVNA